MAVTGIMAAALAISVATTAMSASAQASAADAQNKATSQYSLAQSRAILEAAENSYGQGQTQMVINDAAARQKEQAENMQARSAMATAAVNADARGVSGTSVDAIQHDYENRRDSFDQDVEFNRRASDDEIMMQMKGIQTGSQSQINSVKSNYLQPGPNPLAIGAQFVGSAFSDYAAMGGFKTPPSGTDPRSALSIGNNTPDALTSLGGNPQLPGFD